MIDHGRGHLADVARPLGQVGVGQGGEHGGLSLGGRPDGGDAVGSGPHRVDRRADQGGVRRDQRADVDDAGLEILAALAQPAGERGPLLRDRGERRPDVVLARVRLAPVRFAGSVAEVDPPGADALRHRLTPVATGCGHRPACAAPARAPRMSAVETAPGSSWPTLRGPR